VKFDEFLGAYLGERPGNIVDAHNGNVIGRHRGLWFHTVGQVKILNDGMHFLTQKFLMLIIFSEERNRKLP